MIIRYAKIEDRESIRSLAEKYDINLPDEGSIIVAEDDKGKIVCFANIRPVLMIEPFICENPLAGKRLWEYIREKTQLGGFKILRCFAQKKHEKLYKKLGFYDIFKEYIPMEINFNNNKK